MKFNVYYCENDNYSVESFDALVKKRLLFHRDGNRLEVECVFDPEVSGHSDDRFNVMFKDKNESISEPDRKYFTKLRDYRR